MNFCNHCGTPLQEGSTFCTTCGAQATNTQPQAPVQPQPQAQPYGAPTEKAPEPGKGLAIAGMVLGIVSFLCFPYRTGVLGIIFGGVAKSKGCKSGMATAGIVCGAIGVGLWLLMLIAFGSMGLFAGLF